MKVLKWIGAAIAFVAGAFLLTTARRHQQRADKLVNKAVKHEQKQAAGAFVKAETLRKKASDRMDKAEAAKAAAREQEKKLEANNANDLASRMRDFNNSL